MRNVLAAMGIALAGLAFGVGLGRASVAPSYTAPAVSQNQAPIGLMRVVNDDSFDRECHDDDVASQTVERSA